MLEAKSRCPKITMQDWPLFGLLIKERSPCSVTVQYSRVSFPEGFRMRSQILSGHLSDLEGRTMYITKKIIKKFYSTS